SVHYYDLAERPVNDYLYFGWMKKRLLAAGGKLAQEREVSPSQYPARELVVDLPDNQVTLRRVYLAEARVFWVTAQYPQAAVPPAEAERFLDSFQITSVPKRDKPVAAASKPPGNPVPQPPKASPPPAKPSPTLPPKSPNNPAPAVPAKPPPQGNVKLSPE